MDASSIEKSGTASLAEFPSESPIVKSMIDFGKTVAERGRPPNNVSSVAAATGEIPVIKLFETTWNSQNSRVYGKVELGVIRGSKFEEGFEQEWSMYHEGKLVVEQKSRTSASITAALQSKPSGEEDKNHKLSHTDMSITINKSGKIYVLIDSNKYKGVAQIPGMIDMGENRYSYSGKIAAIPKELERIVMTGLSTIKSLTSPPVLDQPKS